VGSLLEIIQGLEEEKCADTEGGDRITSKTLNRPRYSIEGGKKGTFEEITCGPHTKTRLLTEKLIRSLPKVRTGLLHPVFTIKELYHQKASSLTSSRETLGVAGRESLLSNKTGTKNSGKVWEKEKR